MSKEQVVDGMHAYVHGTPHREITYPALRQPVMGSKSRATNPAFCFDDSESYVRVHMESICSRVLSQAKWPSKIKDMILFPAIDLKEGRCVRLKLGEMASATVYRARASSGCMSSISTGPLPVKAAMGKPSRRS